MSCRLTVMGCLLAGAMATMVFCLESAVRHLDAKLAQMRREYLSSVETVHVLKAEWSYLNGPERLTELSARYLTLGAVGPGQIVTIEQVPFPNNVQDREP